MCGRYSLICIDDLGRRFRVYDPTLGCRSRFNVAPGDTMPVVIQRERIGMVMMQWGLIPHGTTDTPGANHPINARSETLGQKPMFRSLLEKNRCLVPASGFYEWKNDGVRKVPYYIRLNSARVFAFAGLCDVWHDSSGIAHPTYTIITTCANDLIAPIHSRMPVVLKQEDEPLWLSGTYAALEERENLLCPYPSGEMEAYVVSPRVNKADAADDQRLIEPVKGLF